MNLLQAAPALDRLVDAFSGDAIQVDASRCVRQWNRESPCRLCADGCPVQAIALEPATGVPDAPGAHVVLNIEACVQCGYCLHACPTGVFAGRDETKMLLQVAAAISPRASLDLACCHVPVQQAEAGVDAIVEVGGCLAALGAAAYVGLAALGVERIGLRTESCSSCPISSLVTAIEGSTAAAGQLTSVPISFKDAPAAAVVRKPVHATRAPQISRRGLWRRLARGEQAPALPLPAENEVSAGTKQPPQERNALLAAMAQLPGDKRASAPAFPSFKADATCTACQVCANVCPTGALTFAAAGDTFMLQFAPLACTDCGLCTQLCAPAALKPAAQMPYADAHPVVLLAGQQRQCKRCRAFFAGTGELCPTCDFRRKNPTGSLRRPPAIT